MKEPDDVPQRVRVELARVTDRLRAMPLDRLDRVDPDGDSPVTLARAAAQQLADLAADATGRPRRLLPDLAVHATADQLAVTAYDVLAEAELPAQARALDVLVSLRRAL